MQGCRSKVVGGVRAYIDRGEGKALAGSMVRIS
jgi:hypothetical protein